MPAVDRWPHIRAARAAVDAALPPPPMPAWDLPDLGSGWRSAEIGLWQLACTDGAQAHVIAHLGQSLDGRIATESGHSHYIGGQESLRHLHALRSLVDAVIVGIGTVLADRPRLTTRHVEGPNPVRVVIDPQGRLPADAPLYEDHLAPTLVIHRQDLASLAPDHVDRLAVVANADGRLDPAAIVAGLNAKGLRRLLVEGGGQTVSAFLAAGCLHRLQFAVAPLLIGSGRPALALPVIDTLDDARRPTCVRSPLGPDTLFDFHL